MVNMIENLSTLTTIPEKYLTKLFDKIYYVMSDAVVETALLDKEITEDGKKVFLYDSSMNLVKEFASCKLTRDYFGISQSKLKQYINNHDLVDEKYYLSFN